MPEEQGLGSRTHHRRNFGWGKSMFHAYRSALRAHYGGPRYGTEASHASRVRDFITFVKENGINRWNDVDAKLYHRYAEELKSRMTAGQLGQRTCIDRISTLNAGLHALRGDRRLWIAPKELFGRRCNVRKEPPIGLELETVLRLAEELLAAGHPRVASAVEFARLFGMRFRETALTPINECLDRARREGVLDVRKGTKGGRGKDVERLVPVSAEGLRALERAATLIGRNGTNLIPPDWSYQRWYDHAHHVLRRQGPKVGLSSKFHDLRAAYVCERYRVLTGHEAPVVGGRRTAPKQSHRDATEALTNALGHNRTDPLASYYGSSR